MAGVAQYRWNCSVPDDRGVRYIPGIEKDYEILSNVPIISTAGDVVHVYRVQNLNADCTREVTAIEFCYRYADIEGSGEEPVFNWTVLILEETSVFTITRIIAIESHPDELDGNYCMDAGEGEIECCDREDIRSFNFQGSDMFVFGVVESAQGNTHGATLLEFHDTRNEYRVDTLLISVSGHSISVGSTLFRPGGVQRGLLLLWFIGVVI